MILSIRTALKTLCLGGLVAWGPGSGIYAAQRSDPHALPARPALDAGVLDYATGTWTRTGANRPASGAAAAGGIGGQPIYNNTCTWTGGQFFAPSETCWERYDDGRIPSPSDPLAPAGAAECNLFSAFRFGYCTQEATGNVSVQIGFYEGLASSAIGGLCPGNLPPSGNTPLPGQSLPKPPLNLFGPRDVYVDLSNAGLPGAPTGSADPVCWMVTIDLGNNLMGGQPFFSDGEGQFQDDPFRDRFTWVWEQNGTTSQFGATGPLLAAEPQFAPPGAGTYGLPPGSDPIVGGPCGTGLDNVDLFWINVDGSAVGQPIGNCPTLPALGTGCYLVDIGPSPGWPRSPWAGLYMQMFSAGPLPVSACQQIASSTTYCTAKVSTIGCLPQINAIGEPQLSTGQFQVTADQIMNFKNGLLFYGITGPAAIPFSNGDILCVNPPLKRTTLQSSLGNPPQISDCSGTYNFDFFQYYASGIDPNLTLGVEINAQWWYRDPAAPGPIPGPMAASGRGLTNGLMWHWSP